MTRLIRAAVAAIALPLLIIAGSLTGQAPVEAHGPKAWWTHASPFGESGDLVYSYESVKGPRKRFALTSFESYWMATKFRWRGWGSARTVGRGRVHYCDSSGCSKPRRARIILSKRTAFDCAHGVGNESDPHWAYRRSKLWGFDYFEGGSTLTVPRGTTRC